MKKIIIVLFVLLFPLSLQAAQLDSKEDIRVLVENTMNNIAKGEILNGITLLKPYFVIPEAEFNNMLEKYKLQESMIEHRFGKTVGIEFFAEEEAGESLLRIKYLQKFEKHVMQWNFYFYRPEDKWVLNTFYFDDKIQNLFKD